MIGFMREFLLPGPKSPPKLTQTTKTRFAPQLHMNCIFISTVLYILIDLTDYSLVPNVSMLKYFRMSGADKGYIAMFSRTNLFLAILRLNNKVIFNPTKALGKLGNIVAETFVILDVSSNVSMFAHQGSKNCFLANSETFDVSLCFSLMLPSVCRL
jgi:hypothetical protein